MEDIDERTTNKLHANYCDYLYMALCGLRYDYNV